LSIRWTDDQNGLKLHHKLPPNRVPSARFGLTVRCRSGNMHCMNNFKEADKSMLGWWRWRAKPRQHHG